MITKLTKEQEDRIPEFIDEWIGIATSPIQRNDKWIDEMYKSIGKKPPLILYSSSPVMAGLMYSKLRSQLDNQLRSQLDNQLRSQLDNQLDRQLRSQLNRQLYNQLGSQLYSQLRRQLGRQLNSQLYRQLSSQLDNQLDRQLDRQLNSQLGRQLDRQLDRQLYRQLSSQLYVGIWWLIWCGWYSYGDYIGVEFDKNKYNLFINFLKVANVFIAYENIIIVSDNPNVTWRERLLHNEKGMAVKYSDGWGWYCLNGIMMKPEYVLTPAHEITIEAVLAEENVDQRRELIRKVGINRLIKGGKIIEETDMYKLIDMAPIFRGIDYAPHLFMQNPSIDAQHLEGVGPECRTIQQAINWRAGNTSVDWKPSQLS